MSGLLIGRFVSLCRACGLSLGNFDAIVPTEVPDQHLDHVSDGSVFLVCANAEQQLRYPAQDPWTIPPGWTQCMIDVSGKAGTRMVLHQYASGR